jgi:type II secretory pathway pseudopilin PulG
MKRMHAGNGRTPAPAAPRNGRRSDEGGFSIVELVIAMGVLAVALLGIMSLYMNTVTLSEVNREIQSATFAAQQKLEEIRGTPFNSIPNLYPAGTTAYFEVGKMIPVPPDLKPGSLTVDYSNPYLINVTVRIRWRGIRGESAIVPVSTMISPP